LKRAVVSVALNIAEGKGRKTSKDFSHFLNVACASLDEVDAIVSICEELDFIGFQDEIHNKIATLSARINALRNKLRVKDDDNT
jgi:four helix bundle protein